MEPGDILEAIFRVGKSKGTISYEEIYEALPSDLFTHNEINDIVRKLQELGVTVIRKHPLPSDEESLYDSDDKDDASSITKKVLEKIRLKLLDLSKRNRLLNFRETARSIRIIDELPDETFDTVVHEKKGMVLIPLPEDDKEDQKNNSLSYLETEQQTTSLEDKIKIGNELPIPSQNLKDKHRDNNLQTPFTAKPLERRCKRLSQESRTAIDETGGNLLYLAIGFLEWYEDDNSSVSYKAPLILVPVQLERSRVDRKTNCYKYVLSYTEEDIKTNLSLAEKLSRDFDLILPELDNDSSPEEYFDEMAKTVKHKKNWRVLREMVLGMFSFTKLLMYKDLDSRNWPNGSILTNNHITKILGTGAGTKPDDKIYGEEYDIDDNNEAESVPLIRDADSSQHSAIMDVLSGSDLVIDGPPGTGKSQTITNIIAASLYEGKSVLFLAEKKAALEVVRRRLDLAGIGDFCLELHSHKTQKGRLHADIKKRIERKFKHPFRLEQEIKDLIRERDKLRSYALLINTTVGPNEETIHDILWAAERWQSETKDQQISFSVTNALSLTGDEILERVNILEEVTRLHKELPHLAVNAWSGFYPKSILPGDEDTVKAIFSKILQESRDLSYYLADRAKENDMPVDAKLGFLKSLSSINKSILHEIPESYDEDIAIKFTDPMNRKIIRELDDTINEYNDLTSIANELLGHNSELTLENVKLLQRVAENLEDKRFADKSASELHNLIEIAEKIKISLEMLEGLSAKIMDILNEKPSTIQDFEGFIYFSNLINEAPEDIDINAHPTHVIPFATKLVSDVKHELTELRDKIISYSDFFQISRLPNHYELKNLAEVLRDAQGKFFSFLSPSFRKARRAVCDFLMHRKAVNHPHIIQKLDEVADLLKSAYDAQKNPDYLRVLGPLFKGIDTNWSSLETHIRWAQTLRLTVGSQILAEQIITDFSIYRDKTNIIRLKAVQALDIFLDGTTKLRLNVDHDTEIEKIIEKIDDLRNEILYGVEIIDKFIANQKSDVIEIKRSANAYLAADHLRTSIISDLRFTDLLDELFDGMNTNAEVLCKICNWIESLHDIGNVPDKIVAWLVQSKTKDYICILNECIEKVISYMDALNKGLHNLNNIGPFDIEIFLGVTKNDCSLERISDKIETCLDQINYLVTWSDYCRTLHNASTLGLDSITQAIRNQQTDPNTSVANYLSGVYRSMAKEIIRKHSELASFTMASHENARQRFIDLDKKIIERRGEQIAHQVSQWKVPQGVRPVYVRDWTEKYLLDREIAKKKRHIPIRQLLRRAAKALQALKPCFMMSPLSVAQYLEPGKISFDLVIMDEASQIRPEDALGAIARTSQVVVVGDENQLPPTTFFERINETIEEEDETAMDIESILDRCNNLFQRRRLKWHYRSEHESLIAFSNRQFYDEELIVFPSPYRKDICLGVQRKYIKGATYSRGKNLVEAEAVVNAVIEHIKQYPETSLGVVTFNREQRDLIEDILEKSQKHELWLERAIKKTEKLEEPFFIKNLENVQGDERDVIFISTTYGPDTETGKVYQRFGPIGGAAGWRRLNVMYTRAKKRVKVFTSMLPTDLNITDSTPRGVRELRAYLEYAQHGCFPDLGITSKKEPANDFEISVARVLNSYGYQTVPQVGVAGFFIDIGVLHPKRESEFILGIECDGATYHSAKSVRDRDRLRQEILEKKQWKIHRIWSTDWFKNREKEVVRLLSTIKNIIQNEKSEVVQESVYVHDDKGEGREYFSEKGKIESFIGSDEELRKELSNFRDNNIIRLFPDKSNGVLRDEMLEYLVQDKPTTMEEFRSIIPLKLREKTDGHQVQFLKDVFEIIEGYL